MTKHFNRPCASPGCRDFAITGQRFCAKHISAYKAERQQTDRQRGTRTERGYSNAWLKASKTFLIVHPLCAECQRMGRVTPATEVDHIIPHKGNKKLFWDTKNWQPLCHTCHSRKTVKEDGGFGR